MDIAKTDAPPAPTRADAPAARLLDWSLLLAIIVMGSSSFAMIHAAVETVSPAAVVTLRLWIGAGVLYAVMRGSGLRYPALLEGGRLAPVWRSMAAVGLVGFAAPFGLFPWAQQFAPSGLAGVYMAFMPLWTAGLAWAFAGERMTARKALGFGLGFAGVAILMGPTALEAGALGASGLDDPLFVAQAAFMLAAFLYAASAVLSRRAPPTPPRAYSAGVLLCAAVFASVSVLVAPPDPSRWSAVSIANVVALGVFPTAIGALFIIVIIGRVGASFMALANYFTPVGAVAIGAALYGERLEPRAFFALGVILLGVFISQRRKSVAAAAAQTGYRPLDRG
ncbi:MAG: DMT family transporter [Parvularculaceae bacterium]